VTDALPDDTLDRMLALVDADWRLRDAEPVESGHSEVYRLAVDGAPAETYYLKCAHEGDGEGISADARIQRLLERRTEVPVTPVVGVVDDHPDLPAPFHLTEAVPGEALPYEAVGEVDDGVLRTLATDLGRALGALHGPDVVDSFGYVASAGPALDGERPAGEASDLTVVRGREDWPAYLRARVEYELDRHADSRFSGLTDRLESWFDERIAALSGPFEPRLGRNDHGLHNVLLDPATGDLSALPDWAYTLAVPPAFDLEYAVYLYGGSFLAGLPAVRDRRSLVREALLTGYREINSELAERVADPTPCYELLAATRVMNDFHHLRLPEGTEVAVADRLREDVTAALDRTGQS
jgi:aminoglycoside phosphotransferase (APT) family kinase protein